MARKAETPRVGETVAVAEHEIRAVSQLREGFEQRRQLTKREIAGHVGEARPAADRGTLERCERFGVEHHHRGVEPGAAAVVGDVDPGDAAKPLREAVALTHLGAERHLELARRSDGEVAQPSRAQSGVGSSKAAARNDASSC